MRAFNKIRIHLRLIRKKRKGTGRKKIKTRKKTYHWNCTT